MAEFSLGDIIKIEGFKYKFLVVSCNSFIKNNNVFHVCPIFDKYKISPLHISLLGKDEKGIAIIEQIKLIDPSKRNCKVVDRISYSQIMNISDAIQGVFEYD